MKATKLYQVPQGAQVLLPDLGLLGVRKTSSNLNDKVPVEIELEGAPGGGKKRSTYAYGYQDVFVDENTDLLIT